MLLNTNMAKIVLPILNFIKKHCLGSLNILGFQLLKILLLLNLENLNTEYFAQR